jgi:phage FluMu protein Com
MSICFDCNKIVDDLINHDCFIKHQKEFDEELKKHQNKDMKEQTFYCKKCEKDFTIRDSSSYINYNCPDCNTISVFTEYSGILFKGLPNTKR